MASFRYFTEDDVDRMLDMSTVIDVMDGVFRALAEGKAHNVPRVRAKGKSIVLHSMCAAADYLGFVGWKQYTTTRHGARFHVGLYNQTTGELIALIEANRLGQLRTGAVTGLAAKHMAPSGADEVGLIGTGWQAETQLAAVASALPIKRVFCFSRDEQKRRSFAERMSKGLGIPVIPVDRSEDAVRSRPIVITATSSSSPVIDGNWLEPPSLVCAVGSNWLNKAELDVTTVARAANVVCDSVECCEHEAGDFAAAIEQGVFRWETTIDLSQVVAGIEPVQSSDIGITIFKSVGMAIEDVAVAAKLLEVADSGVKFS